MSYNNTRERPAEERAADAIARVKRRPRDDYTEDYMGTQREPRHGGEEVGALAVIDLLSGGRAIIFEIAGDNTQRRVVIVR